MTKECPKRKPTRLRNYDYSSSGAYFITICTENRRKILSVVGGDVPDAPRCVQLLPYGEIADRYIRQLNDFYEDIKVDQYVIMPNHIHIMLFLPNKEPSTDGSPRTSTPTTRQHSAVSRFVSTFKRFCNKEYGKNIWQRNFNDHIIRNYQDYEEHIKYICENPLRWRDDGLYIEG